MSRDYKAYLIDLDGTMYRGNIVIEEAVDFIQRLQQENLRYLFVTNNSMRTKEQVAEKLSSFGIPAEPDDVLTSSMATVNYIKAHFKQPSVFYIGEQGLQEAMEAAGFRYDEDHPDVVVMGLDQQVTYEKIAKATLAVRAGAVFLSTNPDVALPSERGLLPGNGAFTSIITASTGKAPIVIGKPGAEIVEQALAFLQLDRKDVLMVGDNYHTDILAGIHAKVDTLLVHTGVTAPSDLEKLSIQPTYTVATLEDWKW
ncbi:haloacid dehalogenase [Pullulanibacillus camelliae]|uniref:Haloacid dehalogenase n=1 Tax=Pullulanibacillus camelliae TaxID=1707096 RepID=A0A8J2YKD6_9BACL|nr:TIGR01457 family HAD-type hydrolase [Pullulanibacillus camelliae]GGE48542.1 haloacid dehalogenase [Pullulanibacillus camelliae]